jgi:hypothetical protein
MQLPWRLLGLQESLSATEAIQIPQDILFDDIVMKCMMSLSSQINKL